jgi:hypothetical protein
MVFWLERRRSKGMASGDGEAVGFTAKQVSAEIKNAYADWGDGWICGIWKTVQI